MLLGQSLKSRARKSNAGLEAAQPFSVCTNQPVSIKKMKLRIKKSTSENPKKKSKVVNRKNAESKYMTNGEQKSPLKLLRI